MTHIHCDAGWTAGQHVRLRVFFSGRAFTSHPLIIVNALSSTLWTRSRTLTLAARMKGDWTGGLNRHVREESYLLELARSRRVGMTLGRTSAYGSLLVGVVLR